MQVFEHLKGEPKVAMSNIFAMLAEGGNLIWSAPHVSPVHADPSDYWRFTPEGAKYLAEEAGFVVKRLWAPGGVALVGGSILGVHADYWHDSEIVTGINDDAWPMQTYMWLEKPKIEHSQITIHEAMLEEGTDKTEHGFSKVYDLELSHLKTQPTVLLEFGVFQGASLRAWSKFFTSNDSSVIIGADNFLGKMGWTFPDGSPLTFANPLRVLKEQQFNLLPSNAEVLICDQSSILDLDGTSRHLRSRFNNQSPLSVIIDDGSHLMRDQQITFARFFPLLRPGGIYVMEDVHSSSQQGYDVGVVAHKKGHNIMNDWWTLLGTLETTGRVESAYMTAEEESLLSRWIKRVKCYVIKRGESETCLIFKREEEKEERGVEGVKIEVVEGLVESTISYKDLKYSEL
jgi:hypothetical protein